MELLPGAVWRYPDAGQEERMQITRQHLDWVHGLLWFLPHDPCVPPDYRRTASQWVLGI